MLVCGECQVEIEGDEEIGVGSPCPSCERRADGDEDAAIGDLAPVDGIAWTEIRALRRDLEAERAENVRLREVGSRGPFDSLKHRAAEALADEVAALVRRRVIDSRSGAADALLDYRGRATPSTPTADRIASLEAEIERLKVGTFKELREIRRRAVMLREACRPSADAPEGMRDGWTWGLKGERAAVELFKLIAVDLTAEADREQAQRIADAIAEGVQDNGDGWRCETIGGRTDRLGEVLGRFFVAPVYNVEVDGVAVDAVEVEGGVTPTAIVVSLRFSPCEE